MCEMFSLFVYFFIYEFIHCFYKVAELNRPLLILPGFYCSEGSPSAAPVSAVFGDICTPGHYCERGSAVPTPCPVGTHLSEKGGKGADDCMPCPDGKASL